MPCPPLQIHSDTSRNQGDAILRARPEQVPPHGGGEKGTSAAPHVAERIFRAPLPPLFLWKEKEKTPAGDLHGSKGFCVPPHVEERVKRLNHQLGHRAA